MRRLRWDTADNRTRTKSTKEERQDREEDRDMSYVEQDGQGSAFASQGYRVGSTPYTISVNAACAPYSVRTNASHHFSGCEGEVSRSLRVTRVVEHTV